MEKSWRINLGPIEKVPLGQGLCYQVEEEGIAVFRSRDGLVTAIENRCPHSNGPLSEGIIGNGEVVCPLHGHKFDLKTGMGSAPNETVRTFPAWVEEGTLFIEYHPALVELVKL